MYMKTKEELEIMSKDELVSMVLELQENKDIWYNESLKLRNKIEGVKCIVKSMEIFID